MYAVNVVLHEDRGGIPGRTMSEVFEECAADLLREFGGNPDRVLAAAQAAATGAVGSVGYPMLWRQAALAVELCQRAAEITGVVLHGSYEARGQALDEAAAQLRARAERAEHDLDAARATEAELRAELARERQRRDQA